MNKELVCINCGKTFNINDNGIYIKKDDNEVGICYPCTEKNPQLKMIFNMLSQIETKEDKTNE